jgi:hypothetical protein
VALWRGWAFGDRRGSETLLDGFELRFIGTGEPIFERRIDQPRVRPRMNLVEQVANAEEISFDPR